MFCSECGNPVADAATVCMHCGVPVAGAKPEQPATPGVERYLIPVGRSGYAMAAGGILVQVPHSEADEAKEFLDAPPSSDEPPPA